MKAQGGKVVRAPGAMQHGSTIIAFLEDPDGYKVELIQLQKKASPDALFGFSPSDCSCFPTGC
jgi:hypothetical protein